MGRLITAVGTVGSPKSKRLVECPSEEIVWRKKLLTTVAAALCCEIGSSVSPFYLRRWVYANRRNDGALAKLFCFSVWLTPHVQNDAEVGVYSKTTAAFIYRQAAERMPRLLLVAAFAESEAVNNMRSFMDSWRKAEEMLSDEDVKVLDVLDKKDLGAFLYWSLNECQRGWPLVPYQPK
jgi:hypothetical protein